MALTEFQRTICRLIAWQRIQSGESYIAGGAALRIAADSTRRPKPYSQLRKTSGEALMTATSATIQFPIEIGHVNPERDAPHSGQGQKKVCATKPSDLGCYFL
jgi:hypothetical protein